MAPASEVFTVYSKDGEEFRMWADGSGIGFQQTGMPIFPAYLTRESALAMAAVLTKLAASETTA
jgi:hypothetical protein